MCQCNNYTADFPGWYPPIQCTYALTHRCLSDGMNAQFQNYLWKSTDSSVRCKRASRPFTDRTWLASSSIDPTRRTAAVSLWIRRRHCVWMFHVPGGEAKTVSACTLIEFLVLQSGAKRIRTIFLCKLGEIRLLFFCGSRNENFISLWNRVENEKPPMGIPNV